MLLLRNGQTGEAWEPAKSNVLSESGEHWTESTSPTLPFFFSLQIGPNLKLSEWCTGLRHMHKYGISNY